MESEDAKEHFHWCEVCQNSFPEKQLLDTHFCSAYTVGLPFACEVCGKRFRTRKRLRIHAFLHTGLKPHACEICGKAFSLKGLLKVHMVTHGSSRPHVCSICGRSYKQRPHLTNHLRCHTGVKPFVCGMCGKRFVLKDTLRRHLLVHSKMKPYKCNVCQRGYTEKSTLNRHVCRLEAKETPLIVASSQRKWSNIGAGNHNKLTKKTEAKNHGSRTELIATLKKKLLNDLLHEKEKDDDDENRLFLLSLLSEMHKVPAERKLKLKSDIIMSIAASQNPIPQIRNTSFNQHPFRANVQ